MDSLPVDERERILAAIRQFARDTRSHSWDWEQAQRVQSYIRYIRVDDKFRVLIGFTKARTLVIEDILNRETLTLLGRDEEHGGSTE